MTKQQAIETSEKLTEFEEATVQAVAEIDQCGGSRLELQQTLDSVRETLAGCYGENLENSVNEFLGIETVDGEEIDEDDFDEDETGE